MLKPSLTRPPRIARRLMLIAMLLSSAIAWHTSAQEDPPTPPAAPPTPMPHLPVSHTYRTTPQRDLELTVYSPSTWGSDADATPPLRPGIVLFHGGGWIAGSNSQLIPLAMTLADHDMIAVCATYRVQKRDNTKPTDALDDALHAMAWVREHAEQLGIDPTQIAAGGSSAGAALAAACATVPDDRLPAELPASPRPDLLLLFNPVLDNGPGETGYAHDRVGDDHRWFSPTYNVRPDLPPTFVALGTEDDLIPTAVATDFQASMQKQGNTCEVKLYPGQGHGLLFNPPHKIETMRHGIAFLITQDWISPTQEQE